MISENIRCSVVTGSKERFNSFYSILGEGARRLRPDFDEENIKLRISGDSASGGYVYNMSREKALEDLERRKTIYLRQPEIFIYSDTVTLGYLDSPDNLEEVLLLEKPESITNWMLKTAKLLGKTVDSVTGLTAVKVDANRQQTKSAIVRVRTEFRNFSPGDIGSYYITQGWQKISKVASGISLKILNPFNDTNKPMQVFIQENPESPMQKIREIYNWRIIPPDQLNLYTHGALRDVLPLLFNFE